MLEDVGANICYMSQSSIKKLDPDIWLDIAVAVTIALIGAVLVLAVHAPTALGLTALSLAISMLVALVLRRRSSNGIYGDALFVLSSLGFALAIEELAVEGPSPRVTALSCALAFVVGTGPVWVPILNARGKSLEMTVRTTVRRDRSRSRPSR